MISRIRCTKILAVFLLWVTGCNYVYVAHEPVLQADATVELGDYLGSWRVDQWRDGHLYIPESKVFATIVAGSDNCSSLVFCATPEVGAPYTLQVRIHKVATSTGDLVVACSVIEDDILDKRAWLVFKVRILSGSILLYNLSYDNLLSAINATPQALEGEVAHRDYNWSSLTIESSGEAFGQYIRAHPEAFESEPTVGLVRIGSQ